MGYRIIAEWKGRAVGGQPTHGVPITVLGDAMARVRKLVISGQVTSASVVDMDDERHVVYRCESPTPSGRRHLPPASKKPPKKPGKKSRTRGRCGDDGRAGHKLKIIVEPSKIWGVAYRGKYNVTCNARGRVHGTRKHRVVLGKEAAVAEAMKMAQTLVSTHAAQRVDVFCDGKNVGHAKL